MTWRACVGSFPKKLPKFPRNILQVSQSICLWRVSESFLKGYIHHFCHGITSWRMPSQEEKKHSNHLSSPFCQSTCRLHRIERGTPHLASMKRLVLFLWANHWLDSPLNVDRLWKYICNKYNVYILHISTIHYMSFVRLGTHSEYSIYRSWWYLSLAVSSKPFMMDSLGMMHVC